MRQGTQLGVENKVWGRKRQERNEGHGSEHQRLREKMRVRLRAQSKSTLSPGYLRLLHILQNPTDSYPVELPTLPGPLLNPQGNMESFC